MAKVGGNRSYQGGALVTIEDLNGFNRALRAVGNDYPKTLKKANYDLARGLVMAARRKASARPIGTAAKAAKSLRASRGANYAAVTGGGARYKYFFGAEFGSKRYKRFEAWRGNQWGGWAGGPGYFLHPSIRDDGPRLLESYYETLDELTAQAFPDAA